MAKSSRSAKIATAGKPATRAPAEADGPIDKVAIRMYCLGTGDCFVVKFCQGDTPKFTMMIDCGSCRGEPKDFKPYIDQLAKDVDYHIDLLVVTHEHNDHVNGFHKCAGTFRKMTIGEAWFAWTEDPGDPTGSAKELRQKRSNMRKALGKAIDRMKLNAEELSERLHQDFYARDLLNNNRHYIDGLDTLASINLDGDTKEGKSLRGMEIIKQILDDKKVKVRYLVPGDTRQPEQVEGVKFHVLGPPMDREYVFRNGKEGVDVFRKKLTLDESSLAANALLNMDEEVMSDCPFQPQFVVDAKNTAPACQFVMDAYEQKDDWRKIDDDWLISAGSLALRLNSHINNTSLVLAIEMPNKQVLLFPGDAEYGSWASWHEIEKWKPKKAHEKHFVESLLNRTVFYKVGHHLSYNGTALQKGIAMMESEELASMATLDLDRIAEKWKRTMPNKFLLQELIRKCKGKLFIMNEAGIDNGPSQSLSPASLKKGLYKVICFEGTEVPVCIEYNCPI